MADTEALALPRRAGWRRSFFCGGPSAPRSSAVLPGRWLPGVTHPSKASNDTKAMALLVTSPCGLGLHIPRGLELRNNLRLPPRPEHPPCCLANHLQPPPGWGSKPGCKAVSRSFGKLYSKRPRALIDKGPIERLGFLSRGFSKHRQTSGNSTRPQLAQELCDGEGTLPRCSALCVPTERKGWPPPQARKLKQLCAQPCTREGALTTPSCPHHVQLLPGRLPY